MKKLLTLLLIMITIITLAGCSQKETNAEIGEKAKPEQIVVEAQDGYIYVDTNNLEKTDEVEMTLSDGTQVTFSGNVDYSTPGQYTVQATYTNNGESKTEDVTVVVDSTENIESFKQEQAAATQRNFYPEIDGVVYGPEDIAKEDLDMAEKWVQAVYGNDYVIEQGGSGKWYVFVTPTADMNCDDVNAIITVIKGNGGHVSIGENQYTSNLLHGCGY